MSEEKPRVELDWVKLVAGALAAVSSAFLLSRLGAVGTLVGAALGSVIASVTTSVYTTSLERSRQKVLEVQVPVRRRPGEGGQTTSLVIDRPVEDVVAVDEPGEPDEPGTNDPDPGVTPPAGIPLLTPDQISAAPSPPDGTDPPAADRAGSAVADSSGDRSLGALLRAVSWRTVALWAAGLFVAAVLVLTVVELVVGRSAAEITGGSDGGRTSISQWTGGGGSGSSQDPTPAPTGGTTSDAPTSGTTSEPTGDATSAPSGSPSEPTQEPTSSGTVTDAPSDGPTSAPTQGGATSAPAG
ncbi:hypothetical protein RDV89_12925 [Nocardioides zeae]|uniref:Uncharacterized protein n=1 Tax=Nocardioides imazamoxiresistens TaxID=3231893 RepID=A0ABU3PXL9_9ACTN|nr:hypothetical protein [Nocardioides zeae]MDT9593978.1 hypothetical protein [Nocardioides zeae]